MSKIERKVVRELRREGFTVLNRRQWGSKHRLVYQWRRIHRRFVGPADWAFAHITVTRDTGNAKHDAQFVESIGQSRFGSGMSYNWMLHKSTRTIILGQPHDAAGTHTVNDKGVKGFPENLNYWGHAIAFCGMGPGDVFDDWCCKAAAAIIRAERKHGAMKAKAQMYPHSKFAFKDCPCDPYRNSIDEIMELAKQRPTEKLLFAHISMQFSDGQKAVDHDTEKLFTRFERKGTGIVTGTEAGDEKVYKSLQAAAKRHGYRFHRERSVWVAVRKDLMKRPAKRQWAKGFIKVIDSSEGSGPHSDRGLCWVAFNSRQFGRIAVAAGHYLTKGRPSAKSAAGRVNLPLNKRFGPAIGKWAKEQGNGSNLAFYGGDQNIVDRVDDTFFGAPMTSAWDELKQWQNTGHGNIDVIASYDADKRVVAKSIKAISDKKFFLHTDHYLVEAEFEIALGD